MESSRYVVVGAGLAGSATALALARRGLEVTVVERREPAGHEGSSHGSARIFRYAYPDRFYTDLVIRARSGFDELERLSGRRLISPAGAVDFGAARNPAQLAQVLESAGVTHELLSQQEARDRWPQIAFDTEVLWHPDAGVIDAETTVLTQVQLAQQNGAYLLTAWEVSSVQRTARGYRLTSAEGQHLDAENVIVAAGGWLPALLAELDVPAGFLDRLPRFVVTEEQAYHFPYRALPGDGTSGPGLPPEFPTFIHKREDIQTYSLPGGRDAGHRGQKLAEFAAGRVLSSAREQTGMSDNANRHRIIDYVTRYLPGLEPQPYAETTCLFTSTPNEDFLLDRTDGLTLLSPCSGHGAKFAPLIGELAAEVATGGVAPDRFTVAAFSGGLSDQEATRV